MQYQLESIIPKIPFVYNDGNAGKRTRIYLWYLSLLLVGRESRDCLAAGGVKDWVAQPRRLTLRIARHENPFTIAPHIHTTRLSSAKKKNFFQELSCPPYITPETTENPRNFFRLLEKNFSSRSNIETALRENLARAYA